MHHLEDSKLGELYMESWSVLSCLEDFQGLHIQNVKPDSAAKISSSLDPARIIQQGAKEDVDSQKVAIVRKLKGALKGGEETLLLGSPSLEGGRRGVEFGPSMDSQV